MEIFIATVALGCAFVLLRRKSRRRRTAMSGYLPPNQEPYDPEYGERNYESELTPGAKMYRHQWEEEQRKLKAIDGLLGSLTPADADAELFTTWERIWFDIKAHKKRPAK